MSNEGEAVSLNYTLRSAQTWENTTRLSTRLIGFWQNLKGKQAPQKTKAACHPIFAEWMMGWPIGWTDLQELEMAKFQSWLRWHGEY